MTKEIFGLLIIIVLLVVGFAFYQFQTPKTEVEPVVEVKTVEGVSLTNGDYVADTASSTLNWEGRKTLVAGYSDTGVISLKEGSAKVESGQIVVGNFVIDMTSITASTTGKGSGQDMLTKHLKSADFFDVAKFATSSLTVNSVTMIGDQYIASGDLMIKGKTNPIEFPITLAQDGTNISVVGEAVVDRTKWDVRYGSNKFFDNLADNVIDDNFTLKFEIKLKPAGEILGESTTASSTASTTLTAKTTSTSTATSTASTTKTTQ
jgi:polyisoprenoid-binding protein YceI